MLRYGNDDVLCYAQIEYFCLVLNRPHQAKKSMRKMYGFIFYTCAKSHSGIYSPLKHSIVSNDIVWGEQRPRSDCPDGQADLGLCYPHMPADTFTDDAAK